MTALTIFFRCSRHFLHFDSRLWTDKAVRQLRSYCNQQLSRVVQGNETDLWKRECSIDASWQDSSLAHSDLKGTLTKILCGLVPSLNSTCETGRAKKAFSSLIEESSSLDKSQEKTRRFVKRPMVFMSIKTLCWAQIGTSISSKQ